MIKAVKFRTDYRCFKRDVFEKQATSDYVIIESSGSDSSHINAFVRIPIADAETDYWFETEERAGIGFYHRFLQLWNSSADIVEPLSDEQTRLRTALRTGSGAGIA